MLPTPAQFALYSGLIRPAPLSKAKSTSADANASFADSEPSAAPAAQSFAKEFALLLNHRIEQLVRFIAAKGGELYNDDLARELGFKNSAYTSSLLGKITQKLRRIGMQAEGRNGVNWYRKDRVKGRSFLRVRPEVVELFREAIKLL
jgi:ABC-type transporter Mla subunit MlaD